MGSPGTSAKRGVRHGHRPVRPERIRRIPKPGGIGFSWTDRRLVREGHLARLSPEAGMLYLFLVTVANQDGVSYYGEAKVAERTGLDRGLVFELVRELVRADLVAYRHPVYQVLSLLDREQEAKPSPSPVPLPVSPELFPTPLLREARHGDGALA